MSTFSAIFNLRNLLYLIETWDGIVQNVQDNYEEFLKKGMDNEIDLSNEALYRAQKELASYVELANAIREGVNGVD